MVTKRLVEVVPPECVAITAKAVVGKAEVGNPANSPVVVLKEMPLGGNGATENAVGVGPSITGTKGEIWIPTYHIKDHAGYDR